MIIMVINENNDYIININISNNNKNNHNKKK